MQGVRPAASLACLVLAAACARRPVIAIKPGADFSKIERVALLGFDDAARRRGSGNLVASVFEKQLLHAGYSIVERRRVDQVLSEQRLGASGAVEPRTARKLGKLLGVDAFVLGSVTEFRAAEREQTTLKVEDVRREPIIKRVKKRKKVSEGGLLGKDEWVEYEEDEIVGYNTIRSVRDVPQTRVEPAQVGVAARLVDVATGEVLWVGSTTETGFTTEEAAETAAQRILEAAKRTWPINQGAKK